MKHQIIYDLYSTVKSIKDVGQDQFEATDKDGAVVSVDMAAVDAEYALRIPMKAMERLRRKRDFLIAETDWWATSDRAMTAAQTTYRQDLRDLPMNSNPSFDANGELTGVVWPTKP